MDAVSRTDHEGTGRREVDLSLMQTTRPGSSGGEVGHSDTPAVSVVIPCLNEARSIGDCITQARDALVSAGISGEVVVADNGSTDGSREVASSNGARVVDVAERGYGCAVRGGIEAARANLIVLGDGDGQHDFREIGKFLEKLGEGYDLVMGNRFSGDVLPGAMAWTHRYIGNPLLSGLVRLFFHPSVSDAQCGMRALTRDAYAAMDLRTTGFEMCPEMVVKAAHHRLKITEVAITVRPDRRERQPHLRTFPDGWRHLTFILMCSPNWLFIAPGLVPLTLGVAAVSWFALGPQNLGGVVLNTRAQLFGVLLASFGLQVVFIGLFARVFSYSDPVRAHRRSVGRFLRSMKLEQGLAVGGALIVLGFAGDLYFLVPWGLAGFGAIHGVRLITFWSLWIVLGLQMCFSSFFLSMIGISRGDWIGDRSS